MGKDAQQRVISDLNNRYTAKKYDYSKKVSDENLATILEALRLTPSSINSQPWRFIVLASDDAKKRMHGTFANKFQFNAPHILASSHTILFAHNPRYNKQDYNKVIDAMVHDGRLNEDAKADAFGAFYFVELNTDINGNTAPWTKNQLYIALGNALHTLARLKIDATPMEGVDADLINKEFAKELDGYICELALTIGYRHADDPNAIKPKSRLALNDIIISI